MTSLGENIHFYRVQHNLTQRELAEIVHVSPKTIGRWEINETVPSEEFIDILAEALGVSREKLYTREQESEEPKAEDAYLYDTIADRVQHVSSEIEDLGSYKSKEQDDLLDKELLKIRKKKKRIIILFIVIAIAMVAIYYLDWCLNSIYSPFNR